MTTLLGGKRWLETSIYNDDSCNDLDEEPSALDDDYIPEEYRTEEL